MPSIKWHYLLLSYFPLSRSRASDVQCIDKGQSRQAYQHIYNSGRWGWMIMTMELWSSHWKTDWLVGISSTWLESEFPLMSSSSGEDISTYNRLFFLTKCCAVNPFLAGMLMWMPFWKCIIENAVTLICWKMCFLFFSSCCNNQIPPGDQALPQVQ